MTTNDRRRGERTKSNYGPPLLFVFQIDKLDPMQNQLCRVCDEPAAGFHFGAFTCEGCKSFFGRTCNNQSVIQECKNNYQCIINKKNRTSCKACRLRKCLMVGMSKSGSRYGRRSNWFKIHCLMQQASQPQSATATAASPPASLPPTSTTTLPFPAAASLGPSPPPPGLWRPQDVPSPRSVHSEPSGGKASRVSPSHSPVLSSSQSDVEKSISKAILNLRPVKDRDEPARKIAKEDTGEEESIEETRNNSLPLFSAFPAASSALNSQPASLSLLPPTFNIPALANLPLHKQAMLSPLLAASSQMLAAAAAAAAAAANRNASGEKPNPPQPSPPPVSLPAPTPPIFNPFLAHPQQLLLPPTTTGAADLLSEQKSILERFRSSMAAVAASQAAGLSNSEASDSQSGLRRRRSSSTGSPIDLSPSVSPTSRPPKADPVDLTKRADDDDEEDENSMGSEIIPKLSDTEEEEEEESEEKAKPNAAAAASAVSQPRENGISSAKKKRVSATVPLDLTCA